MKIRIGFKTPDAVEEAVRDAVESEMSKDDIGPDVDPADLKYEATAACDKFVKWGECVTIEIDTETGKAEVLEA
jgi:hypothetical protein